MHYVSLKEMLIDDLLGFVLVVVTGSIVTFCLTWYLLERLVFKRKMGFFAAYKYFRSKSTKEPLKDNNSPKERRHTRVSAQPNHHPTTTTNGFLNPSFVEYAKDGNDQQQFNRRLEKFEDDMREVKLALRKLSQMEMRKNKGFDLSGILT